MKVKIVEIETGRIVAVYDVALEDMEHDPADQEYFDHAWLRAVEEGVVAEDALEDYDFEFS